MDKGWILDFGSAVHVCSQKEMLNSMIVKEEETDKKVDSSACEVNDTRKSILQAEMG